MFAPKVFGYAARKTEEHFKERFGGFENFNRTQEEQVGDVIIDKHAAKHGKESQKVGEYIDFEEID